jgi:lysozyme
MDYEKLAADLRRDEGKEPRKFWGKPGLQPYVDTEGHLTIGYGRLIDPALGGGISEEEAEYLLQNDMRKKAISELDKGFPWWCDMPEPAQRGLANMCFQLGLPRLKKFKKTLAYLEAGNFGEAAVECLDSRWAKQTPERAQRISRLFRDAE